MNGEEHDQKHPPSKRQKLGEDNSFTEVDFTEDGTIDKFIIDDEKCNNFVRPDEVERLREFKVLDEVKSNDEDSNDEGSSSSDDKSEDLPEEEIEKMLEEGLPDDFKGARKPKEKTFVTRQKTVLEEKGVNLFEMLPLDWVMVRHVSGMPVYMHRSTRVCTLSKPYFLGKGNTRRHDIPISAMPCYAYRRALEEEAKQKEIDARIEEQIRNGEWLTETQATTNQATGSGNRAANERNLVEHMNVGISKQKCTSNGDVETEKCISNGNVETEEGTSSVNIETESCISNGIIDVEKSTSNSDAEIEKCTSNGDIETENFTLNSDIEPEKNTSNGGNNEKGGKICPFSNVTDAVNSSQINNNEDIPVSRKPVVLPGGIVMPPPRVESVNTSWKTQHLSPEQIYDYCKKLFKFKTVNIMHFKRWADRRKYTKSRKALQCPTLPVGTKLITIPAQSVSGKDNYGKPSKRDWVMNMNERSYLSVFHEYVYRALQKQPVYEFKQLENAASPYQATVYIGGMQYGVGHGSSKRQAKSAAARASIYILIPEMKDELDAHAPHAPPDGSEPDFTIFDYVGIEDPRITEFCAATCEPSPHAILRTCLLRNFGAGDRHINTTMKKLEYQKIELTMTVGKHTATVVCKNKKTAKQRASQAILQEGLQPDDWVKGTALSTGGSRGAVHPGAESWGRKPTAIDFDRHQLQWDHASGADFRTPVPNMLKTALVKALHPHVRSWGSLLRLYGSRSVKSCKEKKLEEQQITLLQDKAQHNEPNYAVLEKLRNEMRKLRERDEAVVSIGTLLVTDDLPRHSDSNLNNVEL